MRERSSRDAASAKELSIRTGTRVVYDTSRVDSSGYVMVEAEDLSSGLPHCPVDC